MTTRKDLTEWQKLAHLELDIKKQAYELAKATFNTIPFSFTDDYRIAHLEFRMTEIHYNYTKMLMNLADSNLIESDLNDKRFNELLNLILADSKQDKTDILKKIHAIEAKLKSHENTIISTLQPLQDALSSPNDANTDSDKAVNNTDYIG